MNADRRHSSVSLAVSYRCLSVFICGDYFFAGAAAESVGSGAESWRDGKIRADQRAELQRLAAGLRQHRRISYSMKSLMETWRGIPSLDYSLDGTKGSEVAKRDLSKEARTRQAALPGLSVAYG